MKCYLHDVQDHDHAVGRGCLSVAARLAASTAVAARPDDYCQHGVYGVRMGRVHCCLCDNNPCSCTIERED